jgi:hypothetical protein
MLEPSWMQAMLVKDAVFDRKCVCEY